jgi:hypothetical protein
MTNHTAEALTTAPAETLVRAVVRDLHQDGSVGVALDSAPHHTFICDRLVTGAPQLRLQVGDAVLCFGGGERGVILGRIGGAEPDAAAAGVPNELRLEAKEEITLRVGDGSITIRGDGRILIKGKDVVSHATRMNRIKGGAVAIN